MGRVVIHFHRFPDEYTTLAQMASTTDRLARARAARQAKTGALAPSEGSERLRAAPRPSEAHWLSEVRRLSEARRLSATNAADILERARAERGAASLVGVHELSLRQSTSSVQHEGDAQVDRASLAGWSAAPDAALAALEGAAGATDKLARARAAREAREAREQEAQPPTMRR